MAVEYGFRALPQTYFATMSRKGELKVMDSSGINVQAIFLSMKLLKEKNFRNVRLYSVLLPKLHSKACTKFHEVRLSRSEYEIRRPTETRCPSRTFFHLVSQRPHNKR